MRKTHSYLKGLAETRARAHGDYTRLKAIHAEVSQKLLEAETLMLSSDVLIKKYDERLQPSLIPPINAWQGRYGKRGALRRFVSHIIERAYPDSLTTQEISWAAQIEFKLDFLIPAEKRDWVVNSLRGSIKFLVTQGLIERLHDVSDGPTGEVGRWRWKSGNDLSLDHLRQQAEAQGVSVLPSDAYHE